MHIPPPAPPQREGSYALLRNGEGLGVGFRAIMRKSSLMCSFHPQMQKRAPKRARARHNLSQTRLGARSHVGVRSTLQTVKEMIANDPRLSRWVWRITWPIRYEGWQLSTKRTRALHVSDEAPLVFLAGLSMACPMRICVLRRCAAVLEQHALGAAGCFQRQPAGAIWPAGGNLAQQLQILLIQRGIATSGHRHCAKRDGEAALL